MTTEVKNVIFCIDRALLFQLGYWLRRVKSSSTGISHCNPELGDEVVNSRSSVSTCTIE